MAKASNHAPTRGAFGVAFTQALAANPNRSYLCIQNVDPTNILLISVEDSAPGAGNGLRLIPGAKWEPESVPVNSIHLGSLVAPVNVEMVEGSF